MKNKFSIGNYNLVSRWLLTGIGGLVIVAFIVNDGYVVATTMAEPTRIQSAGTQGTWGSVAWYFENRRLVLLTGVAPEVADELPITAFLNDPDLREILPLLEEIEIAGEITVGAQGAALFKGLPNLTKIVGLANLKLASTEDVHEMFADNPKLVSLDSENLTVASAKNVNRMFANDPMLEELNLIKVDFKGLPMNRASNIFQGTHNLKKITFMNKAFGQQYHDNLGRTYNHVANEDESLEHVPNDAQYGGKWIQLRSGTNRYPIYTATSAVLTGKQLLQHLGTTSAPGGTWVWAPAIMGVQQKIGKLYVAPTMNEQALIDLTLAHRSAWVRLVKTDQRAMQTWSVSVSYDQKDFLSQLGRQNVTWKVYSNKLMDEPVYVFNGMIDLMVDQSDLQVRDEITFTAPNQSFKPLDLIVSIKDQTGRELSAKQVQVVPNKPINLGQIQHQSFSLQHHYWNVIKPRNQRRSGMIWQGEGLVRNAQITVLGMRDQILTQGQEYDWRSSFIWPDLKGASLQGNVQIQSSTGINRLDTSKSGQYQIEGQILSPDGRIRATRFAYVEIVPRIISNEADSRAVLTREQFSKSDEMVISEQTVRFDQVDQQLITQEIARPQMTQVTETQEIARPQVAQVTETQEIVQPQITQATGTQGIAQPQRAQVTETQEIARPQITQVTETQEITRPQMTQVTETQEIARPQITQVTETQEITRPQMTQVTETQEITRPQMTQVTENQEIAQSQITQITEAREIVQPQITQATGTQGIAQPQRAQVIENQEVMVTQLMKAVEGTQEPVVVLLECKREIVFDEQKACSLSEKDLHKANNHGVVYKEERIKENLSSTEAVNERMISDKNIRQLPATDFVMVAQLSYLGMCLVLGALICGYKEK